MAHPNISKERNVIRTYLREIRNHHGPILELPPCERRQSSRGTGLITKPYINLEKVSQCILQDCRGYYGGKWRAEGRLDDAERD